MLPEFIQVDDRCVIRLSSVSWVEYSGDCYTIFMTGTQKPIILEKTDLSTSVWDYFCNIAEKINDN
jgi:hypothetical protein